MSTPISERLPLQLAMSEGLELIDFRFEHLAMLLDHHSPNKAKEVRQESTFLKKLFERFDKFLKSDQRGINNAKPDLVKSNIRQMLDLLPEQERAAFIQQLQQEQLQICQTNKP
jgi:hypothetical protein